MKIRKLLFIPMCLMLAGCASKSNDDVVIVPDLMKHSLMNLVQ